MVDEHRDLVLGRRPGRNAWARSSARSPRVDSATSGTPSSSAAAAAALLREDRTDDRDELRILGELAHRFRRLRGIPSLSRTTSRISLRHAGGSRGSRTDSRENPGSSAWIVSVSSPAKRSAASRIPRRLSSPYAAKSPESGSTTPIVPRAPSVRGTRTTDQLAQRRKRGFRPERPRSGARADPAAPEARPLPAPRARDRRRRGAVARPDPAARRRGRAAALATHLARGRSPRNARIISSSSGIAARRVSGSGRRRPPPDACGAGPRVPGPSHRAPRRRGARGAP